MPPNPGMGTNSNEHGKNQAETSSPKPSCKIRFTDPGSLTKNEHNTNITFHQSFIIILDNNPALMSYHIELTQRTKLIANE